MKKKYKRKIGYLLVFCLCFMLIGTFNSNTINTFDNSVAAGCANDSQCQGWTEQKQTVVATTTTTTTTQQNSVQYNEETYLKYKDDPRGDPTSPEYDACFVAPCSPGCIEQNSWCGGQTVTTEETTYETVTETIYHPPEQCWRFTCRRADGSPVPHQYIRTNAGPSYKTLLTDSYIPEDIRKEIKAMPEFFQQTYNGKPNNWSKVISFNYRLCNLKVPNEYGYSTINGCQSMDGYFSQATDKSNVNIKDNIDDIKGMNYTYKVVNGKISIYDMNNNLVGQYTDPSFYNTTSERYFNNQEKLIDGDYETPEFTQRCYWEKFDKHETGENCCGYIQNCFILDGKEVIGDYEGYAEATECGKYCYANASNLKDATIFYYGYDNSLYTDDFWKAISEQVNVGQYITRTSSNTGKLNKLALTDLVGNMTKFESVDKANCKNGGIPPKEKEPCVPVQNSKVPIEENAASCEETTVFTYDDDKITCDTATMKGYYTIECQTTFTNSFDLGNDGVNGASSLSIYPGQGFGYKVNTELVKNCTGTFDADLWNRVYNRATSSRDRAASGSAEWYKQNNIVNELKGIVKAFNEWNSTLNDVPNIEMTINTNPKIVVNNFVSTITNVGDATNKEVTKTYTLNDGTKVHDFKISNKSNPRKIEYVTPVTELDAVSGKVATSTTTNRVNGGNKVYTDLNVKPGSYRVDIKVNNISTSKTVTNNKCMLNILDGKDLLYRIIDVTNPFISGEYQKGENWENGQFDYTQIIDKDIWSKNGLYVFDLLKENLKALQKSNGGNLEKYLGTCNLPDNSMDEITKKICSIINNPKK